MEILLETHLHNAEASPCASLPAHQIPELYAKAGYGGIVVTNHFSDSCLNYLLKRRTPKESAKAFFDNSRLLIDEAQKHGLKGFLCAEVTITEDGWQDFLVFGDIEQGFYDNPLLYTFTKEQLFEMANKFGWAVFQAHPFRSTSKVGNPKLMHGIEFFNGMNSGDDWERKARQMVEENGLKTIAGGDFHRLGAQGKAGIFLPENINTEGELSSWLLNNQAKLYINQQNE